LLDFALFFALGQIPLPALSSRIIDLIVFDQKDSFDLAYLSSNVGLDFLIFKQSDKAPGYSVFFAGFFVLATVPSLMVNSVIENIGCMCLVSMSTVAGANIYPSHTPIQASLSHLHSS